MFVTSDSVSGSVSNIFSVSLIFPFVVVVVVLYFFDSLLVVYFLQKVFEILRLLPSAMGYSLKKPKRERARWGEGEGSGRGRGLQTYFFEKPSGKFMFFTLTLETPHKTRLHPRNSTNFW